MLETEPQNGGSSAGGGSDDAEAVYCLRCGYDLRRLGGAACPECGEKIDHAALAQPQIPWVHRREIGRVWAFWRTVWRVTFRTKRFCREIARPVEYAEARRFQRALVWWVVGALVGFAIAAADVLDYIGARVVGAPPLQRPLLSAAAIAVLAGLVALYLFAATGVHTYWLHPRALPVERQNRAVALGYYAGAPLAFVPLVIVWLLVGVLVQQWSAQTWSPVLFLAGGAMLLTGLAALAGIPIACWRACLLMARIGAERRGPAGIVMAVTLPLLWLLLAVLIFAVLPALVAWVGVMVLEW